MYVWQIWRKKRAQDVYIEVKANKLKFLQNKSSASPASFTSHPIDIQINKDSFLSITLCNGLYLTGEQVTSISYHLLRKTIIWIDHAAGFFLFRNRIIIAGGADEMGRWTSSNLLTAAFWYIRDTCLNNISPIDPHDFLQCA